MPRVRCRFASALFMFGVVIAPCVPARADAATPRALLADVYARYGARPGDRGSSGPGMPSDLATLRTLMEPALAEAWARNGRLGATSDTMDGVVDYDPFVEGQDVRLAGLAIGRPVLRGRCADVEVAFRNFGKPSHLTYRLIKTGAGWRIFDLRSTERGSLRGRLRLRNTPSPC